MSVTLQNMVAGVLAVIAFVGLYQVFGPSWDEISSNIRDILTVPNKDPEPDEITGASQLREAFRDFDTIKNALTTASNAPEEVCYTYHDELKQLRRGEKVGISVLFQKGSPSKLKLETLRNGDKTTLQETDIDLQPCVFAPPSAYIKGCRNYNQCPRDVTNLSNWVEEGPQIEEQDINALTWTTPTTMYRKTGENRPRKEFSYQVPSDVETDKKNKPFILKKGDMACFLPFGSAALSESTYKGIVKTMSARCSRDS